VNGHSFVHGVSILQGLFFGIFFIAQIHIRASPERGVKLADSNRRRSTGDSSTIAVESRDGWRTRRSQDRIGSSELRDRSQTARRNPQAGSPPSRHALRAEIRSFESEEDRRRGLLFDEEQSRLLNAEHRRDDEMKAGKRGEAREREREREREKSGQRGREGKRRL